ncbi:MAG: hypothetical protein ABR955_16435, partial [Verrucomicrobiota bacterium]
MPDEPIEHPKDSFLNTLLKWAEVTSVLLVAALIWLTVVLLIAWIVFGAGGYQNQRMTTVLTGLNVNWKLGFLLLIPLFYRTIGEVLERIEEGPGGTKFPKAKKPK